MKKGRKDVVFPTSFTVNNWWTVGLLLRNVDKIFRLLSQSI